MAMFQGNVISVSQNVKKRNFFWLFHFFCYVKTNIGFGAT